jgi:hypothetical protein
MTSDNNEGEKNFNKLTAAAQIAQLLAMNIVAPSPQPNIPNRPNSTDYSAVQKQQPKSCPLDQEAENDLEAQNYESLPGIARLSKLTEQLDQVAELRAGEDKEKREKDWEIASRERNMPKSSGSPDPEPENEEGEYVSEYMKDLESRLETGTLTLKSPEEHSESEFSESETESESEYSESETESESESDSEMKWG